MQQYVIVATDGKPRTGVQDPAQCLPVRSSNVASTCIETALRNDMSGRLLFARVNARPAALTHARDRCLASRAGASLRGGGL